MLHHLRAAVIACLMLGPATALSHETIRPYEFPGAQRTGLLGVNDRGVALGAAIVGIDAYRFLLDIRTDELTVLAPIPGNFHYLVNGLNNDKVLVGQLVDRDDNTAKAFIQQPDGSFETFSHPRARAITAATAISDRGLIAGLRDRRDGTFAGFLYDPATGRFRNFAAGQSLETAGINNRGEVVGQVVVLEEDDPCGGGPVGSQVLLYGFVRHRGGFLTLFQVNGQQTYGWDITDAGRIVGTVYDPPAASPRIFIARIPKEPCVFLTIPRAGLIGTPGIEYVVGGINDSGEIVGTTHEFVGPDLTILRGFIATLRR